MFELLFGKRPFRANTTSTLHAAILTAELVLPGNADSVASLSGQQFLRRLLTRDIETRIGTDGAGGASVFRLHPWFTNALGTSPAIDWEELQRKLSTPPFVPDVCTYNPLTR
jgi:serine/threonine kinase 32